MKWVDFSTLNLLRQEKHVQSDQGLFISFLQQIIVNLAGLVKIITRFGQYSIEEISCSKS